MDSNPQNSFFSSPPAQDPSHYDDLSAPLQPSPDPLPTPASPLDFQQPVSQPEMALSALEQPEASTSTALEQPDAAQKPVAAPAAAKKKATDAAASNGMRKPLPGCVVLRLFLQTVEQVSHSVSAPGETLLPTSRVARIIKLDPDVAMTSKEAIFLIAKMTARRYSL